MLEIIKNEIIIDYAKNGSLDKACEAAGITRRRFTREVGTAKEIKKLKLYKENMKGKCGTIAGYSHHIRHNTPMCDPCRYAKALRRKAQRKALREKQAEIKNKQKRENQERAVSLGLPSDYFEDQKYYKSIGIVLPPEAKPKGGIEGRRQADLRRYWADPQKQRDRKKAEYHAKKNQNPHSEYYEESFAAGYYG